MTKLEQYLVNKWEYSPEWVIHLPTSVMYTWFSLRSLTPLFFTNVSHDYRDSNITNSGKSEVYRHLEPSNYPKTVLVSAEASTAIDHSQLPAYPLIAKPNIGKRGFSAALLKDQADLFIYVNDSRVDFLLQAYIDYPNECGIFYIRHPNQSTGKITSIGLKTLLSITGDGTSSMIELLHQRGLHEQSGSALRHYNLEKTILDDDEVVVIEPIGSHNRGTVVRSGDHLINDQLLQSIESSLGQFELYYGRLDIKYKTWDQLLQGDFKIIEINTITSEPLSIYDAKVGLVDKYKMIYRHLRDLYSISAYLKSQGRQRLSLSSFYKYIKDYQAHMKLISPKKQS